RALMFSRLPDGVRLGLYWSAVASVIVVPVGIALRSWEFPALAFLAITTVCTVGHWMTEHGEGTRFAAMTIAWCAGAALGLALIGFGVYAIVAFEPHCVPTGNLVCFDSESTQRIENHLYALLPITGGAILLAVLTAVAVRAYRDRLR
ncbi:hypothetical protein ACFQ07_16850, partial [Actinomadura adrarensis]